ncbi:MAG: NAD(P)/FAD-dependent oxidoreductase [Promethearchaeota archaeon]
MRKEKVDVLVAGAGPGGSIAAERMARQGINVLLCDRMPFPRYKCCAAGVIWHDIEDFPEIKPVIETYNHAIVAHAPSLQKEITLLSEEKYLMGQTYRATLDNHLASLARKSGATFLDNTSVNGLSLLPNQAGIMAELHDKNSNENFQVEAKILIDASGTSAISRKYLSAFPRWERKDLLIACELDVPMKEKEIIKKYGNERAVHMFFYYKDLPGYAWIFTKKKSLSIGMGTMLEFKNRLIGGRELRTKFADFCNYLETNGYTPKGAIKIENTKHALIPSMSLKQANAFTNNVMQVGDAAGIFVSALSGEGIYYSMLSGKFAAETAIRAFKKQDYSTNTLSFYKKLYMKRLKSELNYQFFSRNYMLFVKRRCEKAVRWAMHDQKLQDFFKIFLGGAYKINRSFLMRLISHYIRLKIKDQFGLLGKKENKKEYDD